MFTSDSYRNFLLLVIFISALTNVVLGGLVFADSPRRKVNRLFTLLCFVLTMWGSSFIALNISSASLAVSFWWWGMLS